MSHSPTQRKAWIETGYQQFAKDGPEKLTIKDIAHDAGVSRTSFYHFFTDLPDFIDHLLERHREIAGQYFVEQKKCKTYDPDLFRLAESYRTSICFHQQLLLHKENPIYYLTYQVLNKVSNEIIYPLWADYFDYQGNSLVGKEIHLMLLDVWYLKIRPEDISYDSLLNNAREIKRQVEAFADSHHVQALSST